MFETPNKVDTHIKHFLSDAEIKKLSEEMLGV